MGSIVLTEATDGSRARRWWLVVGVVVVALLALARLLQVWRLSGIRLLTR